MDKRISRIIKMGVKDQKLRKELMDEYKATGKFSEELSEKIREMDKEHAEILKDILEEIGFPTISKVGQECAKYAWLIVQHSSDYDFMQDYLKQMEEHMFNDVEKGWYQRLVDRILIYKGKNQLYGTQHKLSAD